jgi:hypothetical protein
MELSSANGAGQVAIIPLNRLYPLFAHLPIGIGRWRQPADGG